MASRPSSGSGSRPSQLPSGGGGRVPGGGGKPSLGGGAADLPSLGGSPSQLPSGNRPGGGANRPSQQPSRPDGRPGGGGVAERPSQQPSRPGGAERPSQLPSGKPGSKPGAGAGIADRPGGKPAQRPSTGDFNNFLGIAGGVAGGAALGGALADRPSQLPADRPGLGDRPGIGQQPAPGDRPGIANRPGAGERPARPEQRPNWGDRSQNRNDQWQQRVDNRHDAWNQRADNRAAARADWQSNQQQRWSNLQNAQQDRQNWRDMNREDWQNHREEMWDYRSDRAEDIWDNAQDFYDDVFDDRWWGACGWGVGWAGHYPANPWWWWAPATIGAAATFVDAITPEPVYIDYGMNVIYEGETVYVNNQPVPATEYSQPMIELAVNVEQPPPPLPAEAAPSQPGKKAAQPAAAPAEEWMPFGVFALAQEEKGDPVMFFQISVNREGVISGAYKSIIADDQRPIAGKVDKATQRVAWRIGENTDSIFVTSIANLTLDVSPVAIHFGKERTQTWLLVRMPPPAPAGQQAEIPKIDHKPPPLKKPAAAPK